MLSNTVPILGHSMYNWGVSIIEPYHTIRDDSMVHGENQHEEKRKQLSHVSPSITCGQYFHGFHNQTQTKTINDHCVPTPPTVLLENGSMVHDSNKRVNAHLFWL